MVAVNKIAVVGSGVSGLAAAILLARAGVQVEVYEAKPELSPLGSGISLQGNAIRVFDRLGVWPDVEAAGFAFDGLTLRAPGPDAPTVAELPDVKTGGPDYPAAMGMYRPDLARILLGHAERAGTVVRFGAKVTGLTSNPTTVALEVDGGIAGEYDLVVAADGLNSTVRGLVGIEVTPIPTGMGIWRALVGRPPEVERTELYYGGPMYIAGYTPIGADAMYAFLVEAAQDRFGVGEHEASRIMLEASRAYAGPWDSIRSDLEAGARVNYTWFTHHLVPAPWNRGRVVLIGDAAHSCPPTIAQGAAQGLEDASVLAELLVAADVLDGALWDQFHRRRIARAALVVEASTQLGQWQLDGVRDVDTGGLIFSVARAMAEPA